jgi:hypothetical protein
VPLARARASNWPSSGRRALAHRSEGAAIPTQGRERGCPVTWQTLEPAGSAPVRGASIERWLDALAERERQALYPEVLRIPQAGDPTVVYRRERAGSRLVTVALLHGHLTPEQHAAIGAFRLRQYVLCGLYDASRAALNDSQTDPAMESLAAGAIHVCCGTPDGRLLGYMCMETARHRTSMPVPGGWPPNVNAGAIRHRPSGAPGYVFAAPTRPLFATEFELFGSGVFGLLPYLRQTDVTQARELSRMLRNQVVVSPLSVAATIEIVHTMYHLAADPALAIRATLGCLGREGRTLLAHLGIPVLYAPEAQVLQDQVERARATRGSSYWSSNANAQGQFWPFVVASDDLRRHKSHFAQLDALLTLPITDLRRGLVNFRREGRMIVPETLLPGLESTSIRWTADPAESRAPERAPASPVE